MNRISLLILIWAVTCGISAGHAKAIKAGSLYRKWGEQRHTVGQSDQAMALPPESGVDRFTKLKEFIKKVAPNDEIYMALDLPPDRSWKYSGFIWKGYRIYTRRIKESA